MDVKLTIYDDKRQFFSQVVQLPCVVGRSKQCNIAIVHPLISRQHCEIYENGGLVKARDLGSLNGTFYRGERIGRGVVIPFGEAFSIGALYFLIEAASPETTKLTVPPKDADVFASPRRPPVPPPPNGDSDDDSDDDLALIDDDPVLLDDPLDRKDDPVDLANYFNDDSHR